MKMTAVDIGNTQINAQSYAVTGKRVKTLSILTCEFMSHPRKARDFGSRLTAPIYISSVVPSATTRLRRFVNSNESRAKVIVVGRDIRIPVRNLTQAPKEVGADRLVNAFWVWRKYQKNCVVVDFGTAITFDVIDRRGSYRGGLIAPGVEMALTALNEKTALLPKIRLKHPSGLIGRNTVQSINAGCTYGVAGLCDGILARLVKSHGKDITIVGTGGYAKYIKRYMRFKYRIVPDLTLRAIRQIAIEHIRA